MGKGEANVNDPRIPMTMLNVQYRITRLRFRNRLIQYNKCLDDKYTDWLIKGKFCFGTWAEGTEK